MWQTVAWYDAWKCTRPKNARYPNQLRRTLLDRHDTGIVPDSVRRALTDTESTGTLKAVDVVAKAAALLALTAGVTLELYLLLGKTP
jgi:hypothetical protein